MRKKYHILTWLMLAAVIIVLTSMIFDRNDIKNHGSVTSKSSADFNDTATETLEQEQFTEVPFDAPEFISRGLAVKMVALALEDRNIILSKDREIDYEDTSREDWFDKYFNAGIVAGWYRSEKDALKPLETLTYGEVKGMMKFFSITLDSLNRTLDDKNDADTIPYLEWLSVYELILSSIDEVERPKLINLYVFATPTISSDLEAWEMATDKGKYSFEGISVDSCINKEISALVKGNDILYIKAITDDKPVLSNAYIESLDKEMGIAKVFMGGVLRNIVVSDKLDADSDKTFVADIKIVDNKIYELTKKSETISGIVKMITEEQIELEGEGKLAISENAKYYNLVEGIYFTNYSSVLVGYENVEIVIEQDEVAAILITKKNQIENIRVLLKTSGFGRLYHSEVTLTSESLYTVIRGEQEEIQDAGNIFNVDKMHMDVGERIIVKPSDGSKLKVTSITRGSSGAEFCPEYRGTLEIERTAEGYLIINEVDFEAYLYSVVPSEMPSSYGLEAAKVQAICARSYAYTQILSNRFCKYGAHVDDSIECQVYNNIAETEQSIEAVNYTKGQLLGYHGNIISTNFFSTSCGMTANSGDVWASVINKEFPTTSPEYLKSKYQNDSGSFEELSDEDKFLAFIMDEDIPSYDAGFPWYRWTTTMSAAQIEAVIKKTISSRYAVSPKLIKTLGEDNVFRSRSIEDIGLLQDLWVYSRGDSGIITEMIIQCTNGIYKIATEYNVRAIIAPKNYISDEQSVVVTLLNGSTKSDMSLMPSAFYTMDKIYNKNGQLTKVTFYGGGYGHGVGMSQNGVMGMVGLGYDYKEILKHYYEGTEIITLN